MSSEVGYIVIIKRSGKDGVSFPMNQDVCTIGQHQDSDIRVQLENISSRHAQVCIKKNGQVGVSII